MSKRFQVVSTPLKIEDVVAEVIRREAGAINTFIGTVREFTEDKQTLFLEYQAYVSMAEKKMEEIGAEIKERWPMAETAIVHRIGRLEISDIAVVIAVSTPHRATSYEASRYAIERMKEIVPIWKKEHWQDGEEWIGNQKETLQGVPSKGELS